VSSNSSSLSIFICSSTKDFFFWLLLALSFVSFAAASAFVGRPRFFWSLGSLRLPSVILSCLFELAGFCILSASFLNF
jgi:hypothetical protein